MDSVQQDPNPKQRLQVGSCDYKNCGRPAYYTIDFQIDDMTADLCSNHMDTMLALVGLPDEDE